MDTVAVIVVNWNGHDDTVECLQSLLSNSYVNLNIILIDNASGNNEGQRLRDKFGNQIIFIQNDQNSGFAGGCNIGIKKALELKTKYIMLFNNDAVAKDGFIECLLDTMHTNSNIGIIGPIINYYKSSKIWFAGGKINLLLGLTTHYLKGKDFIHTNTKHYYETEYVSGCCILIKKEVFEEIGLLDEEYFAYYEEVDFCFKAKINGFLSVIEPKCFIEHKKSASAGNRGSNFFSETQAYLIARNGILFGRKNLKGFKLYWYLLVSFTVLPIIRIIFQIRSYKSLRQYFKGLFTYKKWI